METHMARLLRRFCHLSRVTRRHAPQLRRGRPGCAAGLRSVRLRRADLRVYPDPPVRAGHSRMAPGERDAALVYERNQSKCNRYVRTGGVM